jgi:hypothetical protein
MKTIRDEAKKQSASVYLTLISIIQSFALGFLLSAVKEALDASPSPPWSISAQSAIGWLQVTAIFQAVVLCWHVNINNAIVMPRLVGLSDSYIPFLFAIPQFVMISSLQPRSLYLWFLGMSGFALVSFWAYHAMYRKDAQEPENKQALQLLGAFPLVNRVYAIGSAIILGSVGYRFLRHSPSDSVAMFWLVTTNALLAIFTWMHCRIWQRLTAV